jgi:hypothetical protein
MSFVFVVAGFDIQTNKIHTMRKLVFLFFILFSVSLQAQTGRLWSVGLAGGVGANTYAAQELTYMPQQNSLLNRRYDYLTTPGPLVSLGLDLQYGKRGRLFWNTRLATQMRLASASMFLALRPGIQSFFSGHQVQAETQFGSGLGYRVSAKSNVILMPYLIYRLSMFDVILPNGSPTGRFMSQQVFGNQSALIPAASVEWQYRVLPGLYARAQFQTDLSASQYQSTGFSMLPVIDIGFMSSSGPSLQGQIGFLWTMSR